MKKVNQLNIGRRMVYTIKTLANKVNVSEKTIRRWIEEGLVIVPGSKENIRIIGIDVKRFIKKRQQSKRVTLEHNEFYCMSCKSACKAKRGTIKVCDNAKIAKCRNCNGNIRKIFKQLKKGL